MKIGAVAALLFCLAAGVFGQCDGSQAGPQTVGFTVVKIPQGPKTAIWYPATAVESAHSYSKFLRGSVAWQASPRDCGRYPLVIFSHGLDGCGTQSVFLTEQLARAGYIVASPDHADAGCSSDGGLARWHLPQQSFMTPMRWTERSYRERYRDLEAVLDWITGPSSFLTSVIDAEKIAAAGHSLGGYSALALAGGWETWRDPRIKAVLVFSPWARPFAVRKRMPAIHVPVMFQGAQFDLGITPWIRGERGVFAQAAEPKLYVELTAGSHLEWTNAVCLGHFTVAACLDKKANARLINAYSIAFLDRYLRGRADALDHANGSGLRAFLREGN